eukprot:s182_g44.t1
MYAPLDASLNLSIVSILLRHQVFQRRYSLPSSLSPEKTLTGPVSDADAALLEDMLAAERLRELSQDLQRQVLDKGDLRQARNASAVLHARIKEVEGQSVAQGLGQPAPPPGDDAHPGIEALIATYNLDARAANELRSLPRSKQDCGIPTRIEFDQASLIDLSKANKPSAFLMAQLQQLQASDEKLGFPGAVPSALDSML